MRHRKSGRHLNRTGAHRQAMLRNMAVSLIEHETIRTTLAKAKELRRVAEPLITLAKEDSTANRRLAFARTRNKAAVGKLFAELGPFYRERPGGYTRILKCGYRAGDAAPLALVELVGRAAIKEEEEVEEVEEEQGSGEEVEESEEEQGSEEENADQQEDLEASASEDRES